MLVFFLTVLDKNENLFSTLAKSDQADNVLFIVSLLLFILVNL